MIPHINRKSIPSTLRDLLNVQGECSAAPFVRNHNLPLGAGLSYAIHARSLTPEFTFTLSSVVFASLLSSFGLAAAMATPLRRRLLVANIRQRRAARGTVVTYMPDLRCKGPDDAERLEGFVVNIVGQNAATGLIVARLLL